VSAAGRTLGRAALAGLDDVVADLAATRAVAREPYRLDPLLALAEGRIKVWDPDRLEAVPWEPWPNQIDSILSWIDVDGLADGRLRFRNVHVEKSRQEGDTTAFAYAVLWALTYWPVPLLVQHQDLGAVADPGLTYDSFFGKVKFMHERWPVTIGRAPLRFTGGNQPVIRRLDNETGFLAGEGQTADPGRGGRYAGAIIDEAARLRFDRQAQAALTRACPVGRVMLSTPHGEGNVYYELREKRPRGWLFLRHHWTDHPIYARGLHVAGEEPETCGACAGVVAGLPYDPNSDVAHRYPGRPTSPWYDDAVRELTDEQVAQELDIDYAASLVARVYPEYDSAVHLAPEEIPYDPALRLEVAWDYGVAPTAGAIVQESPFEIRVIGDFEVWDATPETVSRVLVDELRALGVSETVINDRSLHVLCVGDPAGEARQLATGRPLVAEYRALGWEIVSRPARIASTVNAVRRLLRPGKPKPLVVSPRAHRFDRHAKANRWPVDKQGNRKPDATEPVNDEHNHMMRAFAYLVHWKYPFTEDEEEAALASARRAAAEREDDGRIDSGLSYDTMF
jgi:hypothetical protein